MSSSLDAAYFAARRHLESTALFRVNITHNILSDLYITTNHESDVGCHDHHHDAPLSRQQLELVRNRPATSRLPISTQPHSTSLAVTTHCRSPPVAPPQIGCRWREVPSDVDDRVGLWKQRSHISLSRQIRLRPSVLKSLGLPVTICRVLAEQDSQNVEHSIDIVFGDAFTDNNHIFIADSKSEWQWRPQFAAAILRRFGLWCRVHQLMVSQVQYGTLTSALTPLHRIIVGVKYCFRYNQRNRARLAGNDPDAVDLTTMPRQRRRREKKLMSMEEVDDKFPLTKYKTWRSNRAEEGLPTAGGINTAASRPASVKNLPRVSEDEDKDNAQASSPEVIKEKITPSEPSSPVVARHQQSTDDADQRPKTATSETATTVQKTKTNEDDDEDADQIQTAIPAEQLPDPGDTCAICIDVLEDDDDIRGLTCGHAFHASCVDPWLTSRRACCPLCKADYYTPKPRPEGDTDELRTRNTREELQRSQMGVGMFITRPGRPPVAFFGRHFLNSSHDTNASRASVTHEAREQSQATVGSTQPQETQGRQQQSWRTRLNLPRMPAISRIRNGASNEQGQQPSPARLEAGQNR